MAAYSTSLAEGIGLHWRWTHSTVASLRWEPPSTAAPWWGPSAKVTPSALPSRGRLLCGGAPFGDGSSAGAPRWRRPLWPRTLGGNLSPVSTPSTAAASLWRRPLRGWPLGSGSLAPQATLAYVGCVDFAPGRCGRQPAWLLTPLASEVIVLQP